MVVEKAVEREMAGSRRQTSGGEFGASAPEREGAVWKKLYYAGDDGALWITWTLRHGVL